MAKKKTTKKRGKKKVARKKPALPASKSPEMTFLLKFMQANPNAEYADAKKAADKAGHTIYPIMWGRALPLLGRKTSKKKKRRAASAPGRPKRGPGRPRKSAPASDGVALPINNDGDLSAWQGIVEGLNGGGKVALQYDGSNWILVQV